MRPVLIHVAGFPGAQHPTPINCGRFGNDKYSSILNFDTTIKILQLTVVIFHFDSQAGYVVHQLKH